MTREEAIKFLNEQKEFLLKGCFWEETRMNINEAFDMAIEALEADVPDTNVGDTISRQAAMEICRRMVWNGTDDYLPMSANAIENEIRQLPPVKVCETAPSDLISKQAAIDALIEWYGCKPNDIEAFGKIIEALPSAQPEQQWIPVSERLPEELTTVLITDKDGDVFLATLIGVINGRAEWTTDGIVAWMPLPEAYKEGENE